jgi:putative effector of murein hydrolase
MYTVRCFWLTFLIYISVHLPCSPDAVEAANELGGEPSVVSTKVVLGGIIPE